MITDLFETITLWDFKTEDAAAVRNADGTWTVTLKVSALKFRADSLGDQTEIPIHDLVDIGVFGDKQPGNTLGKPLHVEKRWITEKETTIELVVREAPKKAGIDPYNKLIDRAPKDNVKSVAVRTGDGRTDRRADYRPSPVGPSARPGSARETARCSCS